MTGTDGPSRRRLLGWVAGVAAVGAAGGVGTRAAFSDRNDFAASVQADELDLEVAGARGDETPTDYGTDGPVRLDLGTLDPGDSGRVAVGLRSCDQPALVWTRVSVADGAGALADALEVRLTADGPDGEETLFTGTLSGLLREYGDGVPLDPCVGCDPLVLVFDWALPAEVSEAVRDATASVRADFFAYPCSDRDADTTNPWT